VGADAPLVAERVRLEGPPGAPRELGILEQELLGSRMTGMMGRGPGMVATVVLVGGELVVSVVVEGPGWAEVGWVVVSVVVAVWAVAWWAVVR